jgi:large subunit ribosomal protein L10
MLTKQLTRVAPWKKEMFQRLAELIEKYPVVAIADLRKVRSSQIQEIRKKLRGQAEVLVAKNTILRKAASSLAEKKVHIQDFADGLAGSNLLLFTTMNPYALILFLNKNKVRVPAKAGDTATSQILIPAGNTGLQPGPVISEFGEVKVTTRIEGGSIWVARDTVVAEQGDTISPKLASLLSKLGMKPMEAGLSIVRAFDEGMVLKPEDLMFDLESYKNDLLEASRGALALAVETEYVVPETAPMIIGNAFREALYLANEAEFPTSENIEDLVKRAYAEMKIMSDAAAQINSEAAAMEEIPAPTPSPEEKAPEAKPPEAGPPEAKPPKEKPPAPKPPEAKPPEPKRPEEQPPVPAKPPEAKVPEAKPAEQKPAKEKPPAAKPPEARAPVAKPAETKAPAKKPPKEKKRQEKVEKKAKR